MWQKSNKLYITLILIIFAAMQVLPSGYLFAAEKHVGEALDRLDKSQTYNFGPKHIIRAVPHEEFQKKAEESIDIETIIEHKRKERNEAEAEIKGPKRGVTEEFVEKVKITEYEYASMYIPQEIVDFLNNQAGEVPHHEIKLSDGKFKVFWREEGLESESIWMQVFDTEGVVIGEKVPLTEVAAISTMLDNVTSFENGNIAAIWHENNASGEQSLSIQFFNQDGESIEKYILTGGRDINWSNLDSVISLSNGNLLVSWRENTGLNDDSLRIQFFDQEGAKLGDTHFLTKDHGSLQSSGIENVTTLANGDTLVIWSETDQNYYGELWMQVFSQDGMNVGERYNVTYETQKTNNIYFKDAFTLDNGYIAIAWVEEVKGKYCWRVRAFDPDTKEFKWDHVSDTYKRFTTIHEVRPLGNGDILIVWNEVKSNSNSVVQMEVIDKENGSSVGGERTLSEEGEWTSVQKIVTLANEDIAIFWHEWKGGANFLKMRIFNGEDGEPETEPYVFTDNCGIQNIYVLPDGKIVVSWSEVGKDIQGEKKEYLKMQIIDENGSELSNPVIVSEEDSAFNAGITDVYLLDNDKIAVIWVGRTEIEEKGMTPYVKTYQKLRVFNLDGQVLGQVNDFTGDRLISKVVRFIPTIFPPTIPLDPTFVGIEDIVTLTDGNIAVIWKECNQEGFVSLRLQIIDRNTGGNIKDQYVLAEGDRQVISALWFYLQYATHLDGGGIEAIWREEHTDQTGSRYEYSLGSIRINGKYEVVLQTTSSTLTPEPDIPHADWKSLWKSAREIYLKRNAGLISQEPYAIDIESMSDISKFDIALKSMPHSETVQEELQRTFLGYIPFLDGERLENLVKSLEGKAERDEFENEALYRAGFVLEEREYIKEHMGSEMVQEFEKAVGVILAEGKNRQLTRAEDLAPMSDAIANFVQKRREALVEYSIFTRDKYEYLMEILGVDISKAKSTRFLKVNNEIDRVLNGERAIREILAKNQTTLTDNEMKALVFYQYTLQPLRAVYLHKLKDIMQDFATTVRQNSYKSEIRISLNKKILFDIVGKKGWDESKDDFIESLVPARDLNTRLKKATPAQKKAFEELFNVPVSDPSRNVAYRELLFDIVSDKDWNDLKDTFIDRLIPARDLNTQLKNVTPNQKKAFEDLFGTSPPERR